MNKKQIIFPIEIKAVSHPRSYILQKAFTNDLNSVELVYKLTDCTTSDLSGATASILLFMRDGSFFQDIPTISGTDVKYTMTEAQGNHAGVAQAQIIVKSGANEWASDKQKFEIIAGLETVVATEVMIKDWTMLTAEARAYLDTAEAAEAARVSAETSRGTAEQGRSTAETGRVTAESARVTAEQGRAAALAEKADKSSTYMKSDIDEYIAQIVNGKLKYDNIQVIKQTYVNYSTGVFATRTDPTPVWSRTGYIPIVPTTTLITHNFTGMAVGGWALYDSNKTYISGGTSKEISVPTNARYVVLTDYKENAVHTGLFIEMTCKSYEHISETAENGKRIDNLESAFDTKEPYNLLDPSTITTGYVTSNGNKRTSSSFFYGMIPVTPGDILYTWRVVGTTPSAIKARFICAYNANGVVVPGGDDTGNAIPYTVPPGAAKVALSFEMASSTATSSVMVLKNTAKPPYSYEAYVAPYNVVSREAVAGNLTNLIGKKVAWLGSSITRGYSWCQKVNRFFDFDHTNCGLGGTAMCYESETSMCTTTRLLGQYANGVAIPDDVDIIFVEAGTNDWARNWPIGNKQLTFNQSNELALDTATFAGACNQFFKNVTSLFPNAIVVAVGAPYCKRSLVDFSNPYGVVNNIGLSSFDYGDALADIAGRWGYLGFNFGRESLVNEGNIAQMGDGLHITTEEYSKRVANVVINHLINLLNPLS